MKPKAVIFDLDGTLCKLKSEEEKNNHDGNETIIPEMRDILLFFNGPFIDRILLTGRKKKEYGNITEKWLEDNDMAFDFDELIMQEGKTAKKNHIFKREKLIELKEKYDIIALFDDNPNLIPVCKELGILMLHVHLK